MDRFFAFKVVLFLYIIEAKGVEKSARFKQNLDILCRHFRKQNIVEDKIMLDSLFRPATLEAIEDNKVTITTDLQWNIDPILEKQSEIESILSNSFSKPSQINVLSKRRNINKKKVKTKKSS